MDFVDLEEAGKKLLDRDETEEEVGFAVDKVNGGE